MSEVAQIVLQNRATTHNWPLSSYPGPIRLPRVGFHNFHSNVEAEANYRTTFLSTDAQDWLKVSGRRSGNVAGPSVSPSVAFGVRQLTMQRRAVARDSKSTSPKKRSTKRTKKAPSSKKKKRSRKGEDSDDDDEDEESEEDDEEETTGAESEAASAIEEEEDAGATAVEGRGGKRGAKVSWQQWNHRAPADDIDESQKGRYQEEGAGDETAKEETEVGLGRRRGDGRR
jgi:sister-chromatid-cohesion protein PDS5